MNACRVIGRDVSIIDFFGSLANGKSEYEVQIVECVRAGHDDAVDVSVVDHL